jgi:hypothetical protein
MTEPAEPMAPAEPSCGNCPHYRAAKTAPAGSPVHLTGICQRFPEAVRKLPNEICGEHPKLTLLRDQQLAGLIAAQLEDIVTAPPEQKKRWR